MIHYTERIKGLMRDVVARVPSLAFIDLDELLVFARYGRWHAEGPFATCHSLNMPTSEPGYYYWRDRQTGEITRRSEWFVTKSPTVVLHEQPVHYLVSFALPRFCNQALTRTRKEAHYPSSPGWIAKLDTIVHELYHIDPEDAGIRKVARRDGTMESGSHGGTFLETVAGMVRQYLATKPDPEQYEFLRYDFSELNERYGGVMATTFRSFPSYPQRYQEAMNGPPAGDPHVRVDQLRQPARQVCYTETDLEVRQFFEQSSAPTVRRSPERHRWSRRLQPAAIETPVLTAAARR